MNTKNHHKNKLKTRQNIIKCLEALEQNGGFTLSSGITLFLLVPHPLEQAAIAKADKTYTQSECLKLPKLLREAIRRKFSHTHAKTKKTLSFRAKRLGMIY